MNSQRPVEGLRNGSDQERAFPTSCGLPKREGPQRIGAERSFVVVPAETWHTQTAVPQMKVRIEDVEALRGSVARRSLGVRPPPTDGSRARDTATFQTFIELRGCQKLSCRERSNSVTTPMSYRGSSGSSPAWTNSHSIATWSHLNALGLHCSVARIDVESSRIANVSNLKIPFP